MLIDDVNRYIALRRSLSYKLGKAGQHLVLLRAFADAAAKRTSAHRPFSPGRRQPATTPGTRAERLRDLIRVRDSFVPRIRGMRSRRPSLRSPENAADPLYLHTGRDRPDP